MVSGAIEVDSTAYLRWRHRFKQAVEHWLPFSARVVGALVGAVILARAAPHFTTWEVYLYATGLQDLRLAAWILAIIFALALICFTLGIAGRAAALVVIGLALLDMQASGVL